MSLVTARLTLVAAALCAVALPACAQVVYAITHDVDPAQAHIPALTKAAAEHANRKENAKFDADLLLQIDMTNHKRHYLIDRPAGMLDAVTWSRDGGHVVCWGHLREGHEKDNDMTATPRDSVFLVLSAAGAPEQRVVIPAAGMHVRSCPELLGGGTRLGFSRTFRLTDPKARAGPTEIVTTDLQGGDVKVIGKGLSPTWSPDGRTILYTAMPVLNEKRQATTRYQVMAMDADGAHPRPVGGADTCEGAFSPDGKRIAYLKLGPGRTDVIVADADGSSARRLTSIHAVYLTPRWIDDGRLMVAANAESLKSLAPDRPGGPPKPAPPVDAGDDGVPGDLQPPDSLFILAADGSSIRRLFPLSAIDAAFDRSDAVDVMALIGDDFSGISGRKPPGHIPWPARQAFNAGLVLEGDKLLRKDDSGTLKPVRDGLYLLPDGRRVTVRGGKATVMAKK